MQHPLAWRSVLLCEPVELFRIRLLRERHTDMLRDGVHVERSRQMIAPYIPRSLIALERVWRRNKLRILRYERWQRQRCWARTPEACGDGEHTSLGIARSSASEAPSSPLVALPACTRVQTSQDASQDALRPLAGFFSSVSEQSPNVEFSLGAV